MSQPIPFIAATADEAVAQIRAKLGPNAVVVNVRPLPTQGLARLWQKPMIEVLAGVPEEPAKPDVEISDTLAEFRKQLQEIREQVVNQPAKAAPVPAVEAEKDFSETLVQGSAASMDTGSWRIGNLLQRTGVLPLHAQSIEDELRARHGDVPPGNLEQEIQLARDFLSRRWKQSKASSLPARHVLIGPAGSGKTTFLCKWLTHVCLVESHTARVWRLDGSIANMAESLSIYCEILGVPIERLWQNENGGEEIGFIDLPGIDWRKPSAIQELGKQLKSFGRAEVHLVLNGAYDTSLLLAQARAFSTLPIADLIITHLDEETRWGKLWNLAFGTNFPLRAFSTGQNIPGDFCAASVEAIFSRQFLRQ